MTGLQPKTTDTAPDPPSYAVTAVTAPAWPGPLDRRRRGSLSARGVSSAASRAIFGRRHLDPRGRRRHVNQPAPSLLFLTTIEVAGMLRISRRTLERMRVEGTGPRYFKVGPGKRSRVLYRQQDVETWLGRFNYGSTSEYGR